MRKTVRITTNIIYYTLLSFFLVYVILSFLGIKFYIVPTGSMEPVIHKGSVVFVDERVDFEEIEVGDIIVYNRNDDEKKIIHRVIIEHEDGHMTTKGDANNAADSVEITEDIFVGKYLYDIANLGKVFQALTTRTGQIAYFAVIFGLFFIDYMFDRKSKKEQV